MPLGPLRRPSAGLLRRPSAGLCRHGVPLLVAASLLVAGFGITEGPWPRPFADDRATVTAVPENGRLGGDIPDGIPDPRLDQPEATGAHPVSYPVGTSAVRSAVARELPGPDTADLALPARVLQAYRSAAASLSRSDAGCHLSWPLLAGIGKVESGHAYGGAVDRHGDTLEPILGPVLDGGPGVAAIPDTDDGRWDTDDTWDRAVGPMQFIPSSWVIHGADGNHDGRRDPNNVVDAALASGGYLCTDDRDVEVEKDRRAAVFSYNHSWDYVDLVLAWADAYAGGTPVLTGSLGALSDDDPSGRHRRPGGGDGTADGSTDDEAVAAISAPASAAPVAEQTGEPTAAGGGGTTPEPTGSTGAEPTTSTATADPTPDCTPTSSPSDSTTPEPTDTATAEATTTPDPTDTASPDASGTADPSGTPSPSDTPACG
ncbi:MAG TPA: lytic murein transglycosylase [Actinomycetes bacterium]|nr:lytic murein transglycosylase [Actinomycetes bacterium]